MTCVWCLQNCVETSLKLSSSSLGVQTDSQPRTCCSVYTILSAVLWAITGDSKRTRRCLCHARHMTVQESLQCHQMSRTQCFNFSEAILVRPAWCAALGCTVLCCNQVSCKGCHCHYPRLKAEVWVQHIRCRHTAGTLCNTLSPAQQAQKQAHAPLTNDATPGSQRSYRRPSRTCELDLYAMANVQPKTTGLPMTIYISNKIAGHGPRIKVSQQYGDRMNAAELFSMSIEQDPRITGKPGRIRVSDIRKVQQFIEANRQLLLDYWYQEPPLDTLDMLLKLTKV